MKYFGSSAVFSLGIVLGCCVFGASSDTPASLYQFTHLSVADGLSQSDVRAIVQDRQGFMWFGTWLGGLNRFDGYTFKVYKHDASDNKSLSNDSVRKLYVDRDGVLWVGTNAGVDRYDGETDSFIHYDNRADGPTHLPHFFYQDKSGTLWLSSSDGLSRFDRASGRFYTYRRNANDPTLFGDTNVWPICEDRTTGLLWVGADDGLTLLDRLSGHFTRYKNDPKDPGSLSSSVVVHIFQDRTGILWVSTARGLNRFNPRRRTFTRYRHDPKNPNSLSDDYVVQTYEDRAGRFWVATNNGLNLMDRSRGSFAHYLHDPDDPSSLSSNVINPGALYEDPGGTFWIGTRSTGIDRLPVQAKGFVNYRYKARDANSPGSDAIGGLAIDSAGHLWLGTETGLDRFDGHTFKHYPADPKDPRTLTPGPQRMVVQDAKGAVWTGTFGGGLDRLDRERVTHFRHDPKNLDSLANDTVASLVPDLKGGLWIGDGKGMDYFDGQHFTHFSPDPTNPAGVPDEWMDPLLLDRGAMVWCATPSMGLVRFDTKVQRSSVYLLDPTQPGIEAANRVHDIYFDGASLWVAAATGLFRFDPATGMFTRHYTEKDGLPSNSTVGVLGDAKGNVWVSTVKGLSKFEPSTEKFRNYDSYDGLPGNEFSLFSRTKAPDGRLYFGGMNGLTAFYPDMLLDNPTPPRVMLTELEVFNEPARIGVKNSPLQKAINLSSTITLRHDQSVFRFQFAALDFTAPQKSRYAYKLESFDKEWQYTDAKRRFATYTNLDPGDYTFRVKASNGDGIWNVQGVALHVRILPPWWNTLSFRAVCALILLTMFWGAYRFRIHQLHQQFEMTLEARVSERTRIARDLHDTLLQSFQGLLLQFKAISYRLQPGDIRKSLDAAIGEASRAITEGRDAVQGLRTSAVETNDLAVAIRAVGEELASAEASQSPSTFHVFVEGTPRSLHPILRDEVYRTATEALRNAFRHAKAHQIEVELRYDEKDFKVRVRDDGKGIDREILSSDGRKGHFGLHGMRERAKLAGGELAIWSEVDSGTELELTIPASRAYTRSARRFWWFRKRPEKTRM